MKLAITIDMNNAAFEPSEGAEVARILREYADSVDGHGAGARKRSRVDWPNTGRKEGDHGTL